LVFKKTPKSANNKNSESKSFTKATKVTQINSKKNSLLDKINAQTQTENFKVVKAKKMKLSAKTAKKLPK
jgi:hypothetical protein